jgi:glucosamine--fructose-6-phosphate aminotransferase (isomerizing)
MAKPGMYTYEEIVSQPKAWEQALALTRLQGESIRQLWKPQPQGRLIFSGCGSTYYLSLALAALFQELTGLGARAVPAGELFLYPSSAYEAHMSHILVAVSRSGTTSETTAAVKRFREAGRGSVIVITNYAESPLAAMGDLVIAIPAGQEKSVAQTRSFASMYVAGVALSVLAAGRKDLLEAMNALPGLGTRLLEESQPLARRLGEDLELDRFYFLGSGSRYGLACETNLKMKEMTLTHSEPFHFLEFRHGPMSMVTRSAAVIGMCSQVQRGYEQAVLEDMRSLGGQVVSLAESEADLAFHSGIPESIRNVLYLPPLQLMAFYRSIAKGLDPDRPQNLSAVVQLDLA